MNVNERNAILLAPDGNPELALPHLAQLRRSSLQFAIDFGLTTLPTEPGLLIIRGARQYGKSTWLESQLWQTIQQFGPGSSLYLNGDEISRWEELVATVRSLLPLFAPTAPVRRLFVDEVTAIRDWQRAFKLLIDGGELRDVLVITTGSRATDLRRGSERLPGRRGRLERSTYLFTPVSFAEFKRVASDRLGDATLDAYFLAGGSPVALREIAENGRLPEYVIELTRDWVHGECASSGRDRASVLAVIEQLVRRGGTPISQASLARDAGLANNTVAQGYIELLADLQCVGLCRAWDSSRQVKVRRKPTKLPFINLLCAVAWDAERLRTVDDFRRLPPTVKGRWYEWLVAQEIWRRAARRGEQMPEELAYWQSKEHGIDYVLGPDRFVEVKAGKSSPLEHSWFARTFPGAELTVITTTPFMMERVRGISLETFLLEKHD